jgi:GntP family gluconate:H+ symporter
MTPLLAEASGHWPLLVFAVSLATVILLISRLRVHAFLALIIAAVLAGVLAREPLPGELGTTKDPRKERGHWTAAVDLTVKGFGETAGKIGVVIALAAIIGVCLVESGAADKVVRRFLALFGERRAGHAIFAGGYFLSIPIFFETYFMLLLPLAQALRLRTGRDYMLYVLAICCGGTVTHSLVAPHPGPLAAAENLRLDIGLTILAGIAAGLLPALVTWFVARRIARKLDAPMRETAGATHAELEAIVARPESDLPPLAWAVAPVLAPLVFIGSVTVLKMFGGRAAFPELFPVLEFLGDRNMALLIGVVIALVLVARQRQLSLTQLGELAGKPLHLAGMIILIASAGGAFGAMIQHAGVGKYVQELARDTGAELILVAWAVTALIRVAQGSATVAMITGSAIVWALVDPAAPNAVAPAYHPIYLFLAVGFGSKMGSWMNDAGFWTVSKVSGFTQAETLKSWSVLVSVASATGLVQCLLLSRLLPFR